MHGKGVIPALMGYPNEAVAETTLRDCLLLVGDSE